MDENKPSLTQFNINKADEITMGLTSPKHTHYEVPTNCHMSYCLGRKIQSETRQCEEARRVRGKCLSE